MKNLFFAIHLVSLAVAVVGIFLADKSALAWLRGTRDTVSHRAVLIAHWAVTIGLAGLILSGLWLFWPMRDFLLVQPLFWVKMVFVSALVVNSFFIEYLMHAAMKQSFASLSFRQKFPLMLSGGISTLSWLGAGVTALLLFF